MKPTIEAKKAELAAFYTHLKEPGYNLKGCTCIGLAIGFQCCQTGAPSNVSLCGKLVSLSHRVRHRFADHLNLYRLV